MFRREILIASRVKKMKPLACSVAALAPAMTGPVAASLTTRSDSKGESDTEMQIDPD